MHLFHIWHCSEWRIVGYRTGAFCDLWKCPVLQGTHPFPKHRLAFSEMVWSHLKLFRKYPNYFKIMRYLCVSKFLSYTGKVSNNLVKRNICFWWQCCHLMCINRVNFRFGLFLSYSVRGTCHSPHRISAGGSLLFVRCVSLTLSGLISAWRRGEAPSADYVTVLCVRQCKARHLRICEILKKYMLLSNKLNNLHP